MNSKTIFWLIVFILEFSLICKSQNDEINLNQNLFENPPDSIPQIFAKSIISVEDRYEYGLAISPNYDEIFFTAEDPAEGLMVMSKDENGIWSNPKLANLRGNNSWEQEAFYTPDGEILYFASNSGDSTHLWRSFKENSTWSKAELLDSPVNNPKRVFWATFTQNNTMYYSNVDEFKIYRSEMVNGEYPGTKIAGITYGSHPSISKDESFILFNYRGDIYVAFRNLENKWGEPIKLEAPISSVEFNETCPCLSPDEKFIFFSRYNDLNNKSDIYWVKSGVIEKLRKF